MDSHCTRHLTSLRRHRALSFLHYLHGSNSALNAGAVLPQSLSIVSGCLRMSKEAMGPFVGRLKFQVICSILVHRPWVKRSYQKPVLTESSVNIGADRSKSPRMETQAAARTTTQAPLPACLLHSSLVSGCYCQLSIIDYSCTCP